MDMLNRWSKNKPTLTLTETQFNTNKYTLQFDASYENAEFDTVLKAEWNKPTTTTTRTWRAKQI